MRGIAFGEVVFETGDVVQLRSGGPALTVVGTEPDGAGLEKGPCVMVNVVWFTANGMLQSDRIQRELLKPRARR